MSLLFLCLIFFIFSLFTFSAKHNCPACSCENRNDSFRDSCIKNEKTLATVLFYVNFVNKKINLLSIEDLFGALAVLICEKIAHFFLHILPHLAQKNFHLINCIYILAYIVKNVYTVNQFLFFYYSLIYKRPD